MNLISCNNQLATRSLASGGLFDLVVIDGRNRVRCTRAAVEYLSEGGGPVLVGTEREYYTAALEFMKHVGFGRVGFRGGASGAAEAKNAPVFYRSGNWLGF